jgi:hypothetical protein
MQPADGALPFILGAIPEFPHAQRQSQSIIPAVAGGCGLIPPG